MAQPVIEIEDVEELGFDDEQFHRASMVDFSVDRSDDLPVGVQLTWKLRAMIAGRVLRPFDRLPSVRELADYAEINVNTARAVYAKLTERGLIASEQGRGTFITEAAESSPHVDEIAAEAVTWARSSGVDPQELAIAIYAAGRRGDGASILSELGTEDPAALRRALRGQISQLEAELGNYAWDEKRQPGPNYLHPPAGRIATAEELEATREELIARLADARAAADERGEQEQQARAHVEEMLRNPGSHGWEMVTSEATGDPDCRNWRVVPRFGPVGAIAGWWRVKVSSGCPLAEPLEAATNGPISS